MTPLVREADLLRVKPLRKRFVDRFRPEDVQRVRDAQLDVMLRFGFRIVKGEILDAAPYGMWSLHHDDNRSYRGGPGAVLGDVRTQPGVGDHSPDADRCARRRQGALSIDCRHATSRPLYKNRRATYWKSAEFMMRRLADLHRDGWDALQQLETYNEPNTYTRGIYRRPTNRQMVRFLAKTYGYRLQQKVLGSARGAVGARVPAPWIGRSVHDRGPAGGPLLRRSVPRRAGRPHVRVLRGLLVPRRARARSPAPSSAPNGIGEPRTVLAGPDHLSYPSLFQWRGEWFMMPETGARRRVEIWRARRFPDEWELETVAIDGVDACDATVCEHDGRWWMFVTLCVPGGPRADEVSLFHADTPLGPWRAHRANPVVSDAAHARSAGALYREGDALIRPSQDARGGYGHAVTLSRIDRLTPREYRETPIGSVKPTWHPRVRGTHTIARSSAFEVVDGRLLRFRRPYKK